MKQVCELVGNGRKMLLFRRKHCICDKLNKRINDNKRWQCNGTNVHPCHGPNCSTPEVPQTKHRLQFVYQGELLINRTRFQVKLSQQAQKVETTSIQRWFNVKTLNQRWIDIVSTLCAHCGAYLSVCYSVLIWCMYILGRIPYAFKGDNYVKIVIASLLKRGRL